MLPRRTTRGFRKPGEAHEKFYIGVDVGSISVKVALMDGQLNVIESFYRRMYGKPLPVLAEILREVSRKYPGRKIARCGATGSAGELVASLIGGEFFNEIVAQSRAISHLCPEVRTVIEMGGQDSKFMFMKPDSKNGDGSVLEDFAMNTVCAAGTGSFLDQQAARMGCSIEEEFGRMALKSARPPRIAGRCSVFAKSDMIHLQQIGTPDYEIMAGLCFAVARSFKSSVARGKSFVKPIAFIGGVASNIGVVRAFEKELELYEGELIIPEMHKVTGAIGAALGAIEESDAKEYIGHAGLEEYLVSRKTIDGGHDPLDENDGKQKRNLSTTGVKKGAPVYIGIDIGSLSTNVVVIDDDMKVVARRYLRTSGRPIQAVTQGLLEIGEEIGGVTVKGIGTTGSGRYVMGDLVGADVVRNEITAQATAAVHFVPDVDTIFEIGGQDSKYISINDGAVVDFEMNKVCAAGTGSFIEEQAERLNLDITKEFSDSAFGSRQPGRFGERCTVFIESDLVSHQQKGAPTDDLAAGLSYSIVRNYMNVVVGDRKIGDKILFQGGVAWNKAVVAVFSKVTGKEIHIPPHHDVTGAVGVAIIARRHIKNVPGLKTNFRGFDLADRKYKITSFECKACDNVCEVSRIKFDGEAAHYYGTRCELFEKNKKKKGGNLPDLFAEREKFQFGVYLDKKEPESKKQRKVVGIPRVLTMHEHFPFWSAFFEEMGCEVILSGKTNQDVIDRSLEFVTAETCLPVKILHGHALDLIKKGADYLFMPSVITMGPRTSAFGNSQTCPLVQASPYIVKSAMDLARKKIELLEPSVHFQRGDQRVAQELARMGKKLSVSQGRVERAMRKGRRAQNRFYESMRKRGEEITKNLKDGQRAVVIISRSYNGCDSGINMDLPRKLKDMGIIALPMDMLPLDDKEKVIHEENPGMYWRSGQRMQSAAEIIRQNPKLNAIYISNFKCGPDSFINYHIHRQMRGKPYLHLEVDEHSADAGMITRCEAFFDSLENVDPLQYVNRERPKRKRLKEGGRVLYMPHMCDHAYALSAALNHFGTEAEVLPKTDAGSLETGRKHSTGKECIPYTLTLGDILKKVTSPDFNPAKSAFFMPATNGPCRLGQYHIAMRLLFDKMGYQNVSIMTPSAEGIYKGFEDISPSFRGVAWRGIVAVDIIQKLLRETRPYELTPGSTDSAYEESLKTVVESVRGGGKDLVDRLFDIRDIFRAVPADRSQRRPIIGIVGEIYVRLHSFSNQRIVRQLEEMGCEAWVAPFSEWMFYCTDRYIASNMRNKKLKNIITGKLFNSMLKKDEKKLMEPFKDDLLNWHEPSTKELIALANPYMEATFEGEAVLSVGKAIDYVHRGCAGIVNVFPFSCMPGTVVSALSKKVREKNNNIPWIDIDVDGMNAGSGRSRLEAFAFQAKQYEAQKIQAESCNLV